MSRPTPNAFPRCLLHIFFSGFFLASCSMFATQTPVDRIGTAVAETLTAQPTWTPPPPPTSNPGPTQTPSPSPAPSDTPTAGPSPTATAPPLPEGDPRSGLNLSRPDYRDDFSISTTWGGPNNESAINMIKDGRLSATDQKADSYVWWSTTVPSGGDVYVEVTAEMTTCSGKDSAGMGVRIDTENFDDGYTLEVSCDGHFRIRKFTAGVVDTLLDWTASPEIIQGPNATNLIGFVARGNALHASVNREIVGSVEDTAFFSGTFALFSNALSTPGLTVHFEHFELWYF
jgi:hypothetical protein